jgi:hypothetical protein
VIEASLFSGVSDWMTVPLLHYESDGVGPKRVGLGKDTHGQRLTDPLTQQSSTSDARRA